MLFLAAWIFLEISSFLPFYYIGPHNSPLQTACIMDFAHNCRAHSIQHPCIQKFLPAGLDSFFRKKFLQQMYTNGKKPFATTDIQWVALQTERIR